MNSAILDLVGSSNICQASQGVSLGLVRDQAPMISELVFVREECEAWSNESSAKGSSTDND